jgi:hypothetical protein
MTLTNRELTILQNTDFLLTKAKALNMIEELLLETRGALEEVVSESGLSFPSGATLAGGKISRGENYRGLPYRVLDQPALLTADDIFAFRTMFWWGHFFSATLHLQGASLQRFRQGLTDHIEGLADGHTFIGVGDTPWEYHFGKDNYAPLRPAHRAHLGSCDFLKLSRKMELQEWQRLPEFAAGFLKTLLAVLEEAEVF